MNGRLNSLVQSVNRKWSLLLSISFGIFLFILFFQPFPLDGFDFNNRLLFVAGFAGIVFIVSFLLTSACFWLDKKNPGNNNEHGSVYYPFGFLIMALCSVAFAFYLRYVGSVGITFFIMFKIVLISLVPPVVLRLFDIYRELLQQNKSLISERKMIQKQIERYEEDNLNKTVEFISETSGENLTLLVSEVVFIQSADNYVEIAYIERDEIRKKLIRNTMKNMELRIKQYSNFIRCHRTCIINTHYIEKLHQDYSSHWISLKGYSEKIPVSRQYLLKLKEAL
jgi:hypothetical protein